MGLKFEFFVAVVLIYSVCNIHQISADDTANPSPDTVTPESTDKTKGGNSPPTSQCAAGTGGSGQTGDGGTTTTTASTTTPTTTTPTTTTPSTTTPSTTTPGETTPGGNPTVSYPGQP